jgi:hypothetical protein
MNANNQIEVTCKNCNFTYKRVKNNINKWSGLCRKCSVNKTKQDKKSETFKVCKKCELTFPKTTEYFLFNKKGFAYSYCRKCKAEWLSQKYIPSPRQKLSKQELLDKRAEREKKKAINDWHKILYATAKSNSIRKNRDFDITEEFILDLFKKQNGLCYWYGVPLISSLETRFPQKPSLDRLDCSLGYTKENVVLSCMAANIGRSNCEAVIFKAFCSLLKLEHKS